MYIADLDYALKNLCKTKEEELELEEKIRDAFKNRVDNQVKDIEHRIDLNKNLHGEDVDVIDDLEQIQQIVSNAANEYRAYMRELGYSDEIIEATDEIQGWQKTWWDTENSKLDFYDKQHQNKVRDIEHERDMALEANPYVDTTSYYKQLQDEYHAEANRLRALDAEKYKEEIQEYQQSWWDAQNAIDDWEWERFNDWVDDRNTYNDWNLNDNSIEVAPDGVKAIGNAFQELADNGRIAKETLEEIKNATGLAGKEWAKYEEILLNTNFDKITANALEEIKTVSGLAGEEWAKYESILLNTDDEETIKKVLKDIKGVSAAELSDEEWAKYGAKFLDAKKFPAKFNQTMSELTNKIFDSKTIAGTGKSEIAAWMEEIERLSKDYAKNLDKIKEAEKNLFEARKKEFDKANDFANTYLESQKTLLQSHFDVENSIAEARHEINKELETSMTMYEYLDEESRELLFNQKDYNKLNRELNEIEAEATQLRADYDSALQGATLETIESITSQYQMQYETLMKSYEIAKADLEIAKKKQKLNNVLNERNVRMFINGSWQWVANTEDVANAKAELADAKYAKQVEEAGLTQQQSINNLTKRQDELEVVIKKFENGVIDLGEATLGATGAIGNLSSYLLSMYKNAGSGSSSSGSSTAYLGSYNISSYNKDIDYMDRIKNAPSESEVRLNNAARNAKIVGEGLESDTVSLMTDAEAIEEWKKAKGHATGTRYTPGGLTKMGEDGEEFYIPSNGRLIPINQPTIGNIPSGGVVFNREQMKNLRTMWDMSNFNFRGGSNFVGSAQPQTIDNSNCNNVIINGMTVDSGSDDGKALISALRRYVGNH